MTDRQIEMTWVCSSCQHRNLGRFSVCQGCANPKDGSEEWEMPADTASAPSVTDPALLEVARGGADWACEHCGASQRSADGSCRSCGAGKPAVAPRPPTYVRTTGCTWGCGSILALLALTGVVFTSLVVGSVWFMRARSSPRPAYVGFEREETVQVEVRSGSWEHRLDIEREQLVSREGFKEQVPRDAIDVKPAGTRVQSVDRVQDGWTTETFDEQVPDGTRTRTVTQTVPDGEDTRFVTEQERCGETCSAGPETCRERCTPNGNGFATCKTTCTPGPRRCEPKYCSRQRTVRTPRTREVTRTVTEPTFRTVQRTRRVPAWKDVERRAPFFTWQEHEWVFDRAEATQGTGFEVQWPAAVLHRGVKERPGQKHGTWSVTVGETGGTRTWTWSCSSEDEYLSFASSASRRARVRGEVLFEFVN